MHYLIGIQVHSQGGLQHFVMPPRPLLLFAVKKQRLVDGDECASASASEPITAALTAFQLSVLHKKLSNTS